VYNTIKEGCLLLVLRIRRIDMSEFLQDPEAIKAWLDEMDIEDATIRYDDELDSMVVDVDGSVDLKYSLGDLTQLPVQFGHVSSFFIVNNSKLTSLIGSPQTVGDDFYCFSSKLTSLEGAPQIVEGDFNVSDNYLTSLEGAPQTVSGDFNVSYNQLTSLEGATQEVGGDFYCYNNQLTSLEGAPQTVSGDFNVSSNQLTSLEGAPQNVDWNFVVSDNQLISLEGMPQTVGGDFYCDINPIKDLSGIGKIGGDRIRVPSELPDFGIAEKGSYDNEWKGHDYLEINGRDNIQAYIAASLEAAKSIATEPAEPTLASIHTTNEPSNRLQTALTNKDWVEFCDLIDDPATRGLYNETIEQALVLSIFDPRSDDDDRIMARNTLEYTLNVLAFEQERSMNGPSR
jgi:hypothetical protein